MLHRHRSERADALVEPLADLLSQAPDDAFAPDVVAVPTKGVERWLAQRLSHRLGADGAEPGVCANVDFPSPSRLVSGVLSTVLDLEPDDDPWRVDRLVWTVLDVVDECAGEPWCLALGRHLGFGAGGGPDGGDRDDVRRDRRLAVARRLAGLFTSYGSQRPAMIRAWADGQDDVPPDLTWQPRLWRLVRDRVDLPSPAERLDDALRLLTDDPARVGLPQRLSAFGPTRLPEDQLRVLASLARHRDVHLWLLHPSAALWLRTSEQLRVSPRRADQPATAHHPLMASTARDATELQLRLTALDTDASDVHHPAPDPPPTLLGALQNQLRHDAEPAELATLTGTDHSVQVHACHGRARQVEVLREVLVGLFATDPTLEPRDVLVMCPDVEELAPLVSATFGVVSSEGAEEDGTSHPGHRLRVALADRSLRRTNPLLDLLAGLLALAGGRVTASEVLDLAASEPVRRRFGLDDDDLDRLRDWAVTAGVRWGEDRTRRARFGLDAVGQGTWDAALDRILLGAAMAEEEQRFVGTALPLDDVDSTDVDLAGRLAELLDRITTVLQQMHGEHPLAHWLDTLDHALDLLGDVAPSDAWQLLQARDLLGEVRLTGSSHATLRLADVRSLLAGRLEGRPTRANFRTGSLTMCSLVPMRSVPHRVVVLLGLDDGVFPRGLAVDGDDVLLRDPLIGERDRRSEDRQLFLDALHAARDHLVVLFTGADERTGATRPPAVPVGELLDALDRTARTEAGGPARDQVLTRHPLQPFDERNFTAGALGVTGPFSADPAAHAAAAAARDGRRPPAPFLPGPLPPADHEDVVALDDLVAAVEHPVKTLLRRRLRVLLPAEQEDVSDSLPLELDALQKWALGDRVLAARMAGANPTDIFDAEVFRGQVPPRSLGVVQVREAGQKAEPLTVAARPVLTAPREVLDCDVALPDGRSVVGTVTDVHDHRILRVVFSRLGPKHRVRAWVQLLAVAATWPDTAWESVTIGRPQGRQVLAWQSVLTAPPADEARARLVELVDLRDRALRDALPLPVGAAHAYAAGRSGRDAVVQAVEDAARAWKPFEQQDEYHASVWGEDAPFSALLHTPPVDEAAWWPDEGSRFGVLARRVWEPLLAYESLGPA